MKGVANVRIESPSRFVEALERYIGRLTTVIAVGGLLLLLILAVFTLADGLLRSLLNAPLDLVREVGDLVAAVAGTCCLPIVVLERGNITLTVGTNILSSRVIRLIDFVVALLVFVVLVAMAWQFCLFAMKTLRANDATLLLNIPKAPFWFLIAGIFWFAVVAQVAVLTQAAAALRRVKR